MHNSLRIFLVLVFLFLLQSQSMAAHDDNPFTTLEKWADVESQFIGKPIEKEIEKINNERRRLALRISQQVFVYARDFKLRELKKLCDEIAEGSGKDIPYLKDKRLMSFAKDFIKWYDGFKVRVTAKVKRFKVGIGLQPIKGTSVPRCKRIDVKFIKLKPSNESQWNEGNPAGDEPLVQTIIASPYDKAEFFVGLQSIYYVQDDIVRSKKFYFSPARDKVEEKTVSDFGVGYSIKYTFEVSALKDSPLTQNRFPVRFEDFLKRYGKNAEALCEEDND